MWTTVDTTLREMGDQLPELHRIEALPDEVWERTVPWRPAARSRPCLRSPPGWS